MFNFIFYINLLICSLILWLILKCRLIRVIMLLSIYIVAFHIFLVFNLFQKKSVCIMKITMKEENRVKNQHFCINKVYQLLLFWEIKEIKIGNLFGILYKIWIEFPSYTQPLYSMEFIQKLFEILLTLHNPNVIKNFITLSKIFHRIT